MTASVRSEMIRSRARTLLARHLADPVARLLHRLHVTPNTVTLMGFAVSLGAASLLAMGSFVAGGALLLAGGLFDLFDGALARLSGRATPFGAFLDSVTDRLSEAAILFGLLFYYTDQDHQVGAILVYLALVFGTLVSYLRARGEGLGIPTSAGLVTRPERVLLLAVGALAGQVAIFLGIVAGLSLLTSVQRFAHVWRRTRSG